jgi:Flp pilus assembly pilin Flp
VNNVFRIIRHFFREKCGQDLAEYCLLMALIGLVVLGIVIKASGGIQAVWGATNTTLASSPGSASPATPGSSPSPGDNGDSRGH